LNLIDALDYNGGARNKRLFMTFFRLVGAGLKEALSGNVVRTVAKNGRTYEIATVTVERANEIALENFNARAREINAAHAARIREAEKIKLSKPPSSEE
jgi:hypothetical protein